jgi:hypothetical protein
MLNKAQKYFVLLVPLIALVIILFVVLTIYLLAIKPSNSSISFTQNWYKHYSLKDWDLTRHAITDIDGDGKDDMVTFTHCVFLSSLNPETIPQELKCEAPGMVVIAFPNGEVSIGHTLQPNQPFRYNWLSKSYLVETMSNIWKVYDINGFQLRVYQLTPDLIFKEITPSILDRIDVVTYQVSHLGVFLVLFIMLSLIP